MINQYDDFDLYKIIARQVNSAIPKEQMKKEIFQSFQINRDQIPAGEWVYMY